MKISSPDKILFPPDISKRELAEHYALVAPHMVPLVRDRPLTLHSYPKGIAGEGIYIKQAPKHFPTWIKRVTVKKRGGSVDHAVANRADTLVYLAGQNVITPHVWLSRADRIEKPDRLIFDFDPEHERFEEVRAAARALGDVLRDHGLVPHAMTSGSRGLHVTVPLRRTRTFEEVRAFADAIGDLMVEQDPKRLTRVWSKAERGDRIYVDTGRNAYAQHAVAPYAVRAKPGAPVATPLRWDELGSKSLRPNSWTLRSIGERLASEGDPWSEIAKQAKPLPKLLS
jgi:bifunctional non-homologous end joining protein LigD